LVAELYLKTPLTSILSPRGEEEEHASHGGLFLLPLGEKDEG